MVLSIGNYRQPEYPSYRKHRTLTLANKSTLSGKYCWYIMIKIQTFRDTRHTPAEKEGIRYHYLEGFICTVKSTTLAQTVSIPNALCRCVILLTAQSYKLAA